MVEQVVQPWTLAPFLEEEEEEVQPFWELIFVFFVLGSIARLKNNEIVQGGLTAFSEKVNKINNVIGLIWDCAVFLRNLTVWESECGIAYRRRWGGDS